MSTFWSLWIIGLTLACVGLVTWVLFANRKVALRDDEEPENRTTGHVYDGIEEYDNPLPKWWFQMFVLSIVFGGIYLVLYPGMGSFKGILGWTSVNALEHEQAKANENNAQTFGKYAQMPIEELIHEESAIKMGSRLFANNCAVCHGADGGGQYGFPNLTDNDWLYGGTPDHIKQTLIDGRAGNMPPLGEVLGETNVERVVEYVLKLSGSEHNAELAAKGSQVFVQNCAVCHGHNAKGNISMGAPNLTDDIWLYEGTREAVTQTVRTGRANLMPAQKDLLQPEKIHLLSAYVYHLSFEYE